MIRIRKLLVIAMVVAVSATASAQVFRIGSAAPENSPWGRTLNRLAAEWQEISNGRVRVQVFHNSVAGDEGDMVRKLRIGQLQAVVMTNTGLSGYSGGLLTLSMPLLIRNQAEFEYVFDEVRDTIEREIADDGFRMISWSTAGWLYFFSEDPVRTPEELRSIRLAASPEEMELVRAYQLMGYQPIAVPYTERLAALANGMVNGYLTVPILAAGFQWFGATPNMLNLKVGPAPGGVMMSERAYRRLPGDVRDELLEAAATVGSKLNEEILELEQNAIETMEDFGLNVVDLSEPERAVWVEELESSYDVMLGLVFDEALFETIQELLRAYRRAR
ncbi:MAG TPA: TRAP transporter substrate-binding protein DctP [Spirochaetia bacterium]|nr:TRAP transporter substrate-binding protein DctP [Spirochaetia bacterium]